MKMEKLSLKDKILDRRNIYTAIYSMESYVFDKGLLDTQCPVYAFNEASQQEEVIANNDLELYYLLADKHNIPYIGKVVDICERRLIEILSNPEILFEIKVFFRLKNYDDDDKKLSFRPLHAARLTDMICMVCMLNVLMFEDDYEKGTRSFSDLSKLIPHNFYGNIPSTNVQHLFCRWQNKYKEYSKDVIDHCREYQKNHTYLMEVCLDIKNFFPSVSPKLLYNYILSKVSVSYNKNDLETIKIVLAKLIFFIIDDANLADWEEVYYSKEIEKRKDEYYMNCGIPQGLPQSYFFGNMCMIEIKRILMKDEYFNGDAYFYVDDSVIYVKSQYSQEDFCSKIEKLNKTLKDWCKTEEQKPHELSKYIASPFLEFQHRIDYCIQFHEEGKSVITPIDETDSQYGIMADFSAETSMASRILCSLDEIDDTISLSKLEALDATITAEINKQKEKLELETGGNKKTQVSSRLKLLRRFKRYFLYRRRTLELRENGGPQKDITTNFESRFFEYDSIAHWFELVGEEIFSAEYRMLIEQETLSNAQKLSEKIEEHEKGIIKAVHYKELSETASMYLYYKKDANAANKMKSLRRDEYGYLKKWAQENYRGLKRTKSQSRLSNLHKFLDSLQFEESFFPQVEFMSFLRKNVHEYNRRIINTYFSELMSIEPSNDLVFVGKDLRKINYAELRILVYLRNRNKTFNTDSFSAFEKQMDIDDVSNKMAIDMGLLSVIPIFIDYVKDYRRIDDLIVTHRITKGLWYNGSKFLHSYTLHNEEHAVTLISKSVELTRRIDYFALKEIDYYILFLACYLHDISMVIHPDLYALSAVKTPECYNFISDKMQEMREAIQKYNTEVESDGNARIKEAGNFLVHIFNEVYNYFENWVRSEHPKHSASFIIGGEKTLFKYLEPTILSYVAKVAESHGADVSEVYGLESRAKEDSVSLKSMMLMIRLADLQDVANDRVNYYLLRQNMKNLSQTSRFHWISHLVTDTIMLNTKYDVVEQDDDKRQKEKPIIETINFDMYLNFKQLTSCNPVEKCKCCQCVCHEDYLQIEIKGGDKPIQQCNGKCSFICYWMMKKHAYLLQELVALSDYLKTVNNSLIQSKINLNLYFQHEMKLDPDMFAHVQEFLQIE